MSDPQWLVNAETRMAALRRQSGGSIVCSVESRRAGRIALVIYCLRKAGEPATDAAITETLAQIAAAYGPDPLLAAMQRDGERKAHDGG